jgi:predicted nucleic acid-binding protein
VAVWSVGASRVWYSTVVRFPGDGDRRARAEAGWDRREPRAALANRLLITDAPLDEPAANDAASIRTRTGVSVADAHVAATALAVHPDADVTVLTSDPDDIRRACGPRRVRIVTL